MPITKYSRFRPEDLEDLDLSDLLQELSDYLLQSGFENYGFQEITDHTMRELREALLQALVQQGKISPEELEQLVGEDGDFADSKLSKMLDRLIQRMQDEGYIRVAPPDPNLSAADPDSAGQGDVGEAGSQVRFELTDKSIDFLGFKALRGLLGGLGKSSFGQHETKELATGVEVVGSSKLYEFGDTLNLDVSRTLLSAVSRQGLGNPLELSYSDLHVHQAEYRSSCATVLMLDCSHSMILYGEDRFTPAKRVCLALSHMFISVTWAQF